MNQQKIFYSKYLGLLILWISTSFAYAQGLCDGDKRPTGALEGAFKIDGDITAGCSPLTVKLKDLSGGTDIRYDFYYDGKAASALDKTGNKDSVNALFANTTIQVYRILQYGKKNGKDTYACKTVSVRPNNQPVFSYSTCNNNFLNIIIPKDPANDFDFYTIEWGDGSPLQTITSLPFTANKNYSVTSPTKTIRVKGENNIPTGCPPPPFQTIKMDSDGNVPKITELEVLSGGKKAKLTFTGAFDKHYIYQRTPAQSYTYPNFKYQSNPGTIEVNLEAGKQNCFMVYRNPACIQLSGEVCTVILDTIIPTAVNVNVINWETINPNQTATVLNTSKIKKVTYDLDWQMLDGNNIFNQKIQVVNSPYNHSITKCTSKYCFQVIAKIEGEWSISPSVPYSSISKSEMKCIDRKSIKAPPTTNSIVSVLSDDNIEVSFTDNSNWPVNKAYYYLFGKTAGIFIKTDSLTSTDPKKFNIKANTSEASYCYKLGYTDVCGSSAELSDEICSVHLKLDDSELLNWTNASPFGLSPISNFELISMDENTSAETTQNSFLGSQISSPVDLRNNEIEAKYKIRATGNGSLNSVSNTVRIPIEALFFVPDIFSPDKNGINDKFEIKGRLGRVNTYNLKIYDRWGKNIVEIKDKSQSWDGSINNQILGNGIYTYQLKIELNNRENIFKIGKFELLK